MRKLINSMIVGLGLAVSGCESINRDPFNFELVETRAYGHVAVYQGTEANVRRFVKQHPEMEEKKEGIYYGNPYDMFLWELRVAQEN